MNAAHYKHTKIIARLLEYGADRDLKDYDGHNALSRVDGDEMRYLIMNTKSFAEIAADAEKAKKAAAEAALGAYSKLLEFLFSPCHKFFLRHKNYVLEL